MVCPDVSWPGVTGLALCLLVFLKQPELSGVTNLCLSKLRSHLLYSTQLAKRTCSGLSPMTKHVVIYIQWFVLRHTVHLCGTSKPRLTADFRCPFPCPSFNRSHRRAVCHPARSSRSFPVQAPLAGKSWSWERAAPQRVPQL